MGELNDYENVDIIDIDLETTLTFMRAEDTVAVNIRVDDVESVHRVADRAAELGIESPLFSEQRRYVSVDATAEQIRELAGVDGVRGIALETQYAPE